MNFVFHVDVNSAFLSWSAVKRLKEDPSAVDLRTIPSVVGGDEKTRHGIVTAKSLPAKKYGIHTADTIASAMKRCPNLTVVPADFATYRSYSKQFIRVLHTYSDAVEQASIDEAYVAIGAKDRDEAVRTAHAIKDEIRDSLGFTVNVGISVNKLLAKMASDFEKPDKVHTLFPEEVPKKMWPLSISELYGCGKKTSGRLTSLGIRTIGDAAKADPAFLKSVLGEKSGAYIHSAANGIGSAIVETERDDRKSYSNERTTAEDITAQNFRTALPPFLKSLSEEVSSRLKKDQLRAGTLSVLVKTSEFQKRSIQCPLKDPTNDGSIFYEQSLVLAGRLLAGEPDALTKGKSVTGGLYAKVSGIRLIGLKASDLTSDVYHQMTFEDLLQNQQKEQEESARKKKLEKLKAMENAIRTKYGDGAIHRGSDDSGTT